MHTQYDRPVVPSGSGLLGAAWLLLLAVIALGLSVSARAAPVSMSGAEKLHRLDGMLQVTGSRCLRNGSDFSNDYAAFAAMHRSNLAKARRELRAQLSQRHGTGARAALGRMDAEIAAEYGAGHPWLNCRDLKTTVRGLALVQGSATLIEAADQILPRRAAPRFALIRN